jgi:hypothetical protein
MGYHPTHRLVNVANSNISNSKRINQPMSTYRVDNVLSTLMHLIDALTEGGGSAL